MTYPEAIDFLYNLRLFGTKLGLENTFALARLNGNPQDRLRFIHVAGTNGKGSTCAMLESIYRAQGLRTGLFTSPHLVSFTERIQVNRTCIPEQVVAKLTERIIRSMGGAEIGKWPFRPTFFEFIAVMALLYFEYERCDLVIWETGMGGRLDATNIVMPLASVITNVQFDHEQWLGSSLERIAAEKAGIIKPGAPVITGTADRSALEVIREMAHRRNSPLVIVSEAPEPPVELPLTGAHQRMNAAVALATVTGLESAIPVSQEAIARGLRNVEWPGRLQWVRRGDCELLLDGAHNPDGARSLAAELRRRRAEGKFTLILGLFRDKPWQEMCAILVPMAARVLLVPLQSERTADVREVGQFCASGWPDARVEIFDGVSSAIEAGLSDSILVIAGSLHLVGEAMEILRISAGRRDDRRLNEWDAANAGRSQAIR